MKEAHLEGIYKLHWGFLKAMAYRYLLDEELAERAVDRCFRKFFEEVHVNPALPANPGEANRWLGVEAGGYAAVKTGSKFDF